MKGLTKPFFIRILRQLGTLPDIVVSEFLRVHPTSSIDLDIQELLKESQRRAYKLYIQLLGEDVASFTRIIHQLEDQYSFDGINLNFGCPMPKIYRKNVGGALLKNIDQLERILSAVRQSTSLALSVKMRVGFSDDRFFSKILELIEQYRIDILFLHARTVEERYSASVHYFYVAHAASQLTCPVFANGDIQNSEQAHQIQATTLCAGVMIGRAAIRYPWIFQEIIRTSPPTSFEISFRDVQNYISLIWEELCRQRSEIAAIHALKAFLKHIALGIDDHGKFLHDATRITHFHELQELLSFLEKRENCIYQNVPYPNLGTSSNPSRSE
ncbi:MAG: tRNA-dihydrouridine synthase family protein [Puniceicoccales bacterium]|jgi:tRNA-dihydrouridine synthase|nr:tRNA-dihydrouridine synthase family protein [Puniceicoccales bacterium]